MDSDLREAQRAARQQPATHAITHEHRITTKALATLVRYHARTEDQVVADVRDQLGSLAPIAHAAWHNARVLVTSYDFATKSGKESLYYLPNTSGGTTVMLRREYRR